MTVWDRLGNKDTKPAYILLHTAGTAERGRRVDFDLCLIHEVVVPNADFEFVVEVRDMTIEERLTLL